MKRPHSHHRYDATHAGEDSLALVLTCPQALSIATRLLQQLRTGSTTVEIALLDGQLTVRPPVEADHVSPSSGRPLKPKASTLMAMGVIAPTHLAGGLRS